LPGQTRLAAQVGLRYFYATVDFRPLAPLRVRRAASPIGRAKIHAAAAYFGPLTTLFVTESLA